MATITGTLESVINIAPEQGTVEVALCGYGSQVPRFNGIALIARITASEIPVQPNGTFTFGVTANDEIAPDGTYYTVTIKDSNGDIAQINAYRFLSSGGSYDLNSIDPFNPNFPPPPVPPPNALQVLGPADHMVFDGTFFTTFKTTLPGNVTAPVFQHMKPGNLYTFIIQEDGAGDHTFAWPANVHNPTMVDPTPNGGTIQTFVADENGELWPIGPGTYYAI